MKQVDQVSGATYITLVHLPVAPFIFLTSLFLEGTDWIEQAPNLNWTIIGIVIVYQSLILSLSHIIWQKVTGTLPVSQIVPWTLLLPVFAVAMASPIFERTGHN